MSVFEHARVEIWNGAQHPYKHPISDFNYTNPAFGDDVVNLEQALDYIVAVLYPQVQAAVADVASLPAVGNTINDMRVVNDDGDGKAASYRWEQREGEASASWHKIYDVDFGTDSILQAWQIKTQDLYVHRYGYDDRDASGVVVAGTLAGQSIYGGASANTNLTLFANSGDGVGAATGYVQFGDNVRPITNDTFSLGTTLLRFANFFTQLATVGTLSFAGGSITDSSGAISFANENLSTTGYVDAGGLRIAAGSITDGSGAISFANENLSTTGTLAAGVATFTSVQATGASSALATGTTVGDLTLANGSITSSSGAITFNDENLSTTGSVTTGQLNADNLRLDGNTLSATSGVIALGTAATTGDVTTTGTLIVNGQLNADNLRLDGNTFSSTDVNGNVNFAPNGTGAVTTSAVFRPTTDNTLDLGATATRFNDLFMGGSVSDGTNSIAIATLLSFRDALVGADVGHALFYDGSKWNSSLPNTEIDHGTVTGLGDDDHTHYALLAGRNGGQTLVGDIAASGNLNLDSTANVTKGKILAKSDFAAFTDAAYSGGWTGTNLGGASNRFNNVYSAGEFIGLRLENLGVMPASSAQKVGRLYFNTTDGKVYVDDGSSVAAVSSNNHKVTDTTGWDGVAVSVAYDVSASVSDARDLIWVLKDNTNTFRQMAVDITCSATHVTVTVAEALPAGTYTLIGVG